MTTTTTSPPYRRTDLSFINSVEDLDAEILRLRGRIDVHETVIKHRIKRAPVEALKLVMPGYLATKVSAATISAVASAVGLVFAGKKTVKGMEKRAKEKSVIRDALKKLAVFSGLGFGFKKWMNKEDKKNKEHQVNLNE